MALGKLFLGIALCLFLLSGCCGMTNYDDGYYDDTYYGDGGEYYDSSYEGNYYDGDNYYEDDSYYGDSEYSDAESDLWASEAGSYEGSDCWASTGCAGVDDGTYSYESYDTGTYDYYEK
jgi:hypothetical protein